ncbi:DUF3987 domain-containing protein [Flavobacterium sp.]|uniref:DUF3987 domain-containing protein n=1 Tax=Flavobacterium sp. TaxID=239 RepID=UPI0025B7DFF6|nr:DUF3987 domain-containing protein [Flavobacterium sp.]MBA4155640.1 hypothetical protein [Flavobacterium sp.]
MDLDNLNGIETEINNVVLTDREQALTRLDKIIENLPDELSNLIESAFKCNRIPKEYLFSSILFAFSNAAGLTFSIDSSGYTNYANLYLAIIGSRGDSKSPAMDLATDPLVQIDNQNYDDFKNIVDNQEENKEVRKQLFIQDATIEAAIYCHFKNKDSIGIFVDELTFLIEKMANKNSSEGAAWRTFLLQGNTNKFIDISRKTTLSYRIEKSYPTLLGSIQTQLLSKLFANGNLESGLIDRILFTPKLTSNNTISKENIKPEYNLAYKESLQNLYQSRIDIGHDNKHREIKILLDQEAESKILEYQQELIYRQEKEENLVKEYISKMMINIYKISLLLHLIKQSKSKNYYFDITLETVDSAIEILEFFYFNFKIILKETINPQENEIKIDDVIKYAILNGKLQKDILPLTDLDKSTISRKWNKTLNNMQLATNPKTKLNN